jgi:hypothetical protein
MKKLVGNNYKEVNYFGVNLLVQDYVKFLVTDNRGDVYGSRDKPKSDNQNGWWNYYSVTEYVATVDLEGMDWKDTLMEVE